MLSPSLFNILSTSRIYLSVDDVFNMVYTCDVHVISSFSKGIIEREGTKC